MTLDLAFPHQRALSDLLQAERSMRQQTESVIRDLQQVLLELAIRLDGERFEVLRRSDPGVPGSWTVKEWRGFFSQVSLPVKGWGGASQKDTQAQRELMQQLEALKAKLAKAEGELETERKKPTETLPILAYREREHAPVQNSAAIPLPENGEGMVEATPPVSLLIEDVKKALPSFPKKPAASFSKVLDGGHRTGGDLVRAFQRYWTTLYLVGHWRLAVSMELEEALAAASSVSVGAGSLRRVLGDLIESNILVTETLQLQNPATRLKLFRLSADGERLYQALFARRPNENEWSRLIRLHEGERFPGHTLGVIAFAMHARKRGYAAQVLPEAKSSKTPPDLWISRGDEKLYVEVELGEKERTAKWRNQSKLNDGRVALCARTTKSRSRLVGDCKLDHLPGVATDLESLVTSKFKEVTEDTPLWLESW